MRVEPAALPDRLPSPPSGTVQTDAARSLAMWSPAAFPAVEVHVGREQSSVMPRHVHDEVQIGAYEGGLRRFHIGTRELDATAGSLVVVPSGEPHAGKSEGPGSTFRVMFIQGAFFGAMADEVGRRAGDLAPFAGQSPCYSALLTVVEALASGTYLQQEGLLLEFVAHLLGRHPQDGRRGRREPRAIRAAKEYLREHLEAPVTLDHLAREVGLSKYYFLRAFRDVVGVPPHAYLTHLRVARGKTLLRAGIAPAEVAASLGFADQSHFSRHFRRYVGASPRRYQREILTGRAGAAVPRPPRGRSGSEHSHEGEHE